MTAEKREKFKPTLLQTVNDNIKEIRSRAKDFCVASVIWNNSEREISDFKNWYKFLGVSNIYIVDNGNEHPIDDAVIKHKKKRNFYDCVENLKRWVKENAKEKYIIFCDSDEFLYIEKPSVLDHLERHPLAVNWFCLVGDLPRDADTTNSTHPVFSYNTGNFSSTVKVMGKVEDLSETYIRRSHYHFSKDLKVCDSYGNQRLMRRHKKNGIYTVDTDVWKNQNFHSIWFLHLKMRSEEHWKQKTHPASQWSYYRADNFKDWLGDKRIKHLDNRHMSWMKPFQEFLLEQKH